MVFVALLLTRMAGNGVPKIASSEFTLLSIQKLTRNIFQQSANKMTSRTITDLHYMRSWL